MLGLIITTGFPYSRANFWDLHCKDVVLDIQDLASLDLEIKRLYPLYAGQVSPRDEFLFSASLPDILKHNLAGKKRWIEAVREIGKLQRSRLNVVRLDVEGMQRVVGNWLRSSSDTSVG